MPSMRGKLHFRGSGGSESAVIDECAAANGTTATAPPPYPAHQRQRQIEPTATAGSIADVPPGRGPPCRCAARPIRRAARWQHAGSRRRRVARRTRDRPEAASRNAASGRRSNGTPARVPRTAARTGHRDRRSDETTFPSNSSWVQSRDRARPCLWTPVQSSAASLVREGGRQLDSAYNRCRGNGDQRADVRGPGPCHLEGVERLSPLDASFLSLETPSAHMHVGWLSRLELPQGTDALDVDGVRERIAARLHLAPRFRRRVLNAPLGEPFLSDDPDFRIEHHVVAADMDRAGVTETILHEVTDRFLSEPLDRGRPLWQLRTAGRLAALGLRPRRTMGVAESMRRAAFSLAEQVGRPAPRSYLNRPIRSQRTLLARSVPFARLERLKARLRVKLNDIVIAVATGALRRHAALCEEELVSLRAMVPVNVRGQGEDGAEGNRIVFAFVELPVGERDPLTRVDRIRAQTVQLKHAQHLTGSEALVASIGQLPSPLKVRAARLVAGPRVFNLTISNVPGPRMPLYVGGARVASCRA